MCRKCRSCGAPRFRPMPQVVYTAKPKPWVRRRRAREERPGTTKDEEELKPQATPMIAAVPKRCKAVAPPPSIAAVVKRHIEKENDAKTDKGGVAAGEPGDAPAMGVMRPNSDEVKRRETIEALDALGECEMAAALPKKDKQ
eukprot:669397-Alexandrium_andersonii.AAC.1